MTEKRFVQICKKYISAEFYDDKINEDEIYVVWLCRILQKQQSKQSSTQSNPFTSSGSEELDLSNLPF